MPPILATTNGRPALCYAGEAPWHRLGTKLDRPATAAEAIDAAGLNFEVDVCNLQTECGLAVPQRRATVRHDTKEVLGSVGSAYQPIQNRECFSFMDELVGEGGLRYDVAGALGRGERVWLLARVPGELRISGTDDVSQPYLTLTNSHDGSSSLRAFFTSIRIVCANTYQLAHRRGRGQGISIRHRGDIQAHVQEAREILGIAHRHFQTYNEQANQLAKRQLTGSEVSDFFEGLFPERPDHNRPRSGFTLERLHELFETGLGQDLPGVAGTAWAAVNSVTEFVDHHSRTRGRDADARTERRLKSSWFGPGAQLKQRAFQQALTLAV